MVEVYFNDENPIELMVKINGFHVVIGERFGLFKVDVYNGNLHLNTITYSVDEDLVKHSIR